MIKILIFLLFILDKMGKKHHIGGTTRILTYLVCIWGSLVCSSRKTGNVNIQATQKPSMIIVLQQLPGRCQETFPQDMTGQQVLYHQGLLQPFMSPGYPGGPRPLLRIPNKALGGVPGSQPLLPSGMDPTRQQGDYVKVKVKQVCRISKEIFYSLKEFFI